MDFLRLFSTCMFSHASDPVIVRVDGVTRFECRNCQADLGEVLAGQKFRQRKTVKARKRKSADVLRMARKVG